MMDWTLTHRERRGFALIELLVVIAIIAVLIALLLPAVRDGPTGSTAGERKNVVPGRYNVDSRLEAEVKKDGPNTFDLRITSAPDKPAAKRRR